MGTCGQSYHERLEFHVIGRDFWCLGKPWMGTLVQWIFWPFCLGNTGVVKCPIWGILDITL